MRGRVAPAAGRAAVHCRARGLAVVVVPGNYRQGLELLQALRTLDHATRPAKQTKRNETEKGNGIAQFSSFGFVVHGHGVVLCPSGPIPFLLVSSCVFASHGLARLALHGLAVGDAGGLTSYWGFACLLFSRIHSFMCSGRYWEKIPWPLDALRTMVRCSAAQTSTQMLPGSQVCRMEGMLPPWRC